MSWKRILNHELGNFWKPTVPGSEIEGKLLSVDLGQNGRFLVLETAEGVLNVGITTVMEKLPWDNLVGKLVKIIYAESLVSKTGRTYMLFDVDVEA